MEKDLASPSHALYSITLLGNISINNLIENNELISYSPFALGKVRCTHTQLWFGAFCRLIIWFFLRLL